MVSVKIFWVVGFFFLDAVIYICVYIYDVQVCH